MHVAYKLKPLHARTKTNKILWILASHAKLSKNLVKLSLHVAILTQFITCMA